MVLYTHLIAGIIPYFDQYLYCSLLIWGIVFFYCIVAKIFRTPNILDQSHVSHETDDAMEAIRYDAHMGYKILTFIKFLWTSIWIGCIRCIGYIGCIDCIDCIRCIECCGCCECCGYVGCVDQCEMDESDEDNICEMWCA